MFVPTRDVAEAIVREHGTPAFVTDEKTLIAQAKKMRDAFGEDAKIFFAVKANFNLHILKSLRKAGIYGIDTVSPNEIRVALDAGFPPERIIYTPSNPSNEEMRMAGEAGVLQNLGSLSEIRRFTELFPGKEVSIRICPEAGAGEFEQMVTGQADSKFGIELTDIDETKRITDEAGVTITGVHCHIGSGFYEDSAFRKAAEAVSGIAERFPDARFIDLGGGFGVSYRPGQSEVDIRSLAKVAHDALSVFKERTGRSLDLYLEPGKYLVSNSGALLTTVTTVKQKGGKCFIGVDTGFNHLLRPAMYGAYHHVVNLSRQGGDLREVVVAGNLCETGDVINRAIEIASPEEGDVLAVLTTGGYGSSMSSNYNMRNLAPEVLITEGEEALLTRRRQTYEEMVGLFTPL